MLRGIGALVVVVWLVIGGIAVGQRGYVNSGGNNCAKAGTIAVTVLAGPLNYVEGVDPKVQCKKVPQPSNSPRGPGGAPGPNRPY